MSLSSGILFQFSVSAIITNILNLLECHLSKKPDLALFTSVYGPVFLSLWKTLVIPGRSSIGTGLDGILKNKLQESRDCGSAVFFRSGNMDLNVISSQLYIGKGRKMRPVHQVSGRA